MRSIRSCERMQELEPSIRHCSDEVERRGGIPAELIEALTERGLFHLNIPTRSGVEQATHIVATFIDFDDQVRCALLLRRAGRVLERGTRWVCTASPVTTGCWTGRSFSARIHGRRSILPAPMAHSGGASIDRWLPGSPTPAFLIGTAQGALDDLAGWFTQATSGDMSPLRGREPFRLAYAKAQADVSAARAWVQETWTRACTGIVERIFRTSGTRSARLDAGAICNCPTARGSAGVELRRRRAAAAGSVAVASSMT